jgi:hypothetical protein
VLHHPGFEKPPDERDEVLVRDPSLQERDELPMLNRIEVALDVALNDVVVLRGYLKTGMRAASPPE